MYLRVEMALSGNLFLIFYMWRTGARNDKINQFFFRTLMPPENGGISF